MSRCYPFPSPKNQRSDGGAHKEPWCVKPLKIQNGRETVQSKPWNEKKVQKDKTKVRKRDEGIHSLGDKRHKSNKSLFATGNEDSRKSLFVIGNEEEQERSDLTEEHEEPVRSQGYCYLVGSSNDSSNRNKDEAASSFSEQRRNIIRIRLPSQKPKDADKVQLCSTSGREGDVPQQDKFPIQLARQNSTSSLGHNISISIPESVSGFEKASCTSGSKNKGSTIFEEAVPTLESLYTSLIEDWVPPILHPEQGGSNKDWLFGNNVQAQMIKRVHAPCIGSTDLYPRARYIPEADLHALPYTVPF